jgi:hypothetical protein
MKPGSGIAIDHLMGGVQGNKHNGVLIYTSHSLQKLKRHL